MTTWQTLLTQITSYLREQDTIGLSSESEFWNPYYSIEEIERLLLIISQRYARMIPLAEMQALGRTIVKAVQITSPYTMPLAALDIIQLRIQVDASSKWYPAQYVSPGNYFQTFAADSASTLTRYTIFGGAILFPGVSAKVVFLMEPTLANFRNDVPLLPPAFDAPRLEWVLDMLEVEDFMPRGQV